MIIAMAFAIATIKIAIPVYRDRVVLSRI